MAKQPASAPHMLRMRHILYPVAAARTSIFRTPPPTQGAYWLEETLLIDKQLTLTSAEGLGYRVGTLHPKP